MGLSLRRSIGLIGRGGGSVSGAALLLAGETQGFALDFTDDSARIIDTGTPANNYSGAASLGLLTYTSPSTKMVTGADGTLKFVNHNLLLRSQEFDNASWTKSNAAVTANAATAPDGTTTADKFYETATTAEHSVTQHYGTSVVGQTITFSIFAKAVERSQIALGINSAAVSAYSDVVFDLSSGTVSNVGANNLSRDITAVGNGWYRCSVTVLITGATASPGPFWKLANGGVRNYAGDGTSGILIWGAEVKRTPVHDDGTLSDYIATTSAAVYRLPIDHDTSGNKIGLLVEEQRTSLGLYSSDFTNAAWTKSNMTAALTATGPDGVANSASTLTATAGNATALQAITSASAARITSCYIKRRTGTGNIDLTQDNGTTWTTVTVTSSWTRVSIASVTSTNPTIGIRIVTSGDAVDVAHFQHELGAFITSPIPTTSAQVTRAADQVSVATTRFPYSATAGTLVAAFRARNVAAARRAVQIDDGTANERVTLGTNSTPNALFTVIDGGASQAAIATGTPVANTNHKAGARWASNDFALSFDGGAVSTDVSGTLPTMTTLRIGSGVSSAEPLNGWLRQLTYLPVAESNADLVARTA